MIPLRDYNPSSSRPVVTILFILACTAVFLYTTYGLSSAAAGERFVLTYGAAPAVLPAPGGPVNANTARVAPDPRTKSSPPAAGDRKSTRLHSSHYQDFY